MTETPSPMEAKLFAQLDSAVDAAGSPTAREISKLIREDFNRDLAPETIKVWLDHRHLPRKGESGEAKFRLVIKALGANEDCDWVQLLREAHAQRDARLRAARRPKRADTEEMEEPPDPTVPPAQDSPRLPSARAARRRLLGLGVPVWASIVAAVVVVIAVAVMTTKDENCAIVTAEPDSKVWRDPGVGLIKAKRHGERVEFYTALEPARTETGTYRAVHVRQTADPGYGWMLEADLSPTGCG